MRWKCVLKAVLATLATAAALWSQTPQVIAVRAGHLFDAESGKLLANQVVLIQGDRIAEVGPAGQVAVPAGAKVIDLSQATVLPGMIDAHVHVIPFQGTVPYRTLQALTSAQDALNAGFTTLVDMASRDTYATIDLRNAIDNGVVQGPRMQVAGPAIDPRAARPMPSPPLVNDKGIIGDLGVNSPWEGRAAVRKLSWYGADWIKIFATQDFAGDQYKVFKPDGTMVNIPSLTLEEIKAIVDEAHRRDMKVACHAYGGEALHSCIEAGVDLTMHAPELDDESLNMLVQKKLPLMFTLDDLIGLAKGDLKITGGKESRLSLDEIAFKKTLAAGVPMPFGSGASTGSDFPLGKEANQFAWFVKWGMTPTQALQTAFMVAANVLNYNWASQVGSIEKGKYADIIAVSGNPLQDVNVMEHVKFVMKGGVVVRNDLK